MAARYWIGGSGNWNDTAHWAASSGGSGGQTVPTSSDDCFFDANSFSAGSRTITFNVSPSVKSMDFTGATNNPIIIPTNSSTIAGNLKLISGMIWGNSSATITFNTDSTVCNLTTAGVTIGQANINISGTGTFNHLDPLTIENGTSGRFQVVASATVNTNDHSINVRSYQMSSGSGTPTINLGQSIITIRNSVSAGSSVVLFQSGTILNAGTSRFIIDTSGVNDIIFNGGGKTLYDVEINRTLEIVGANIYNSLTIDEGKTIEYPSLVTQTIGTLNAVGTAGSPISFRTSGVAAATLCVTTLNIAYVDTENIIASCAASPFYCPTCTDSGSNVNWTFSNPTPPATVQPGAAPGSHTLKPQIRHSTGIKPKMGRIIKSNPFGISINTNNPKIS